MTTFFFVCGVFNHATTAHIFMTAIETKEKILYQIFAKLDYQ